MEHAVRKKRLEELREQWRKLWRERMDDKVRAEGIADADFPNLSVERGRVIFATRDFKPLNFRNVLLNHGLINLGDEAFPNPYVGGWGKFIRTEVAKQNKEHIRRRRRRPEPDFKKKRQHLRKGGRGWLRINA